MHVRNGIRRRERRTYESNIRTDLKSNMLQHYTAFYYLQIEVLGFCGYGRQTQCKLSLLSSAVFRGRQGTFTVCTWRQKCIWGYSVSQTCCMATLHKEGTVQVMKVYAHCRLHHHHGKKARRKHNKWIITRRECNVQIYSTCKHETRPFGIINKD